jgi:hypothetical protein
MTNEITALIENIWQSPDKEAAVIRADRKMSSDARERLHAVMGDLTPGDEIRDKATENDDEQISTREMSLDARALLLVTLSWHHSDSLLYLPFERRERRLSEWASWTGFSVEAVRQAAALGPAGLKRLLD